MALVLAGDRIAENVSAQMDDILSMAINNSYHRLRADLTNQLRAAVKSGLMRKLKKSYNPTNVPICRNEHRIYKNFSLERSKNEY